jgi:transcriptional regulator with XRE-family HTH domain
MVLTMQTGSAFGAALADAMRAERVEVKELARRAGVGDSTVYAYLSGRRHPSRERIGMLADALHLDEQGRRGLFATAGLTVDTDLPEVAAGIVRKLPPEERERAVEVLRALYRTFPREPVTRAQQAREDARKARVTSTNLRARGILRRGGVPEHDESPPTRPVAEQGGRGEAVRR